MSRQPGGRTLVYVTSLVVTALLVAIALLGAGYDLESPWTVLALALASAVAERISVRFTVARLRTYVYRGAIASIFSLRSSPLCCSVRSRLQWSARHQCLAIPNSLHAVTLNGRHD